MRDGLVLRYDTRARQDGLEGREGAFLAAAFGTRTTSSCLDGVRRQKNSSSIFLLCATMSVCWPRNTMRGPGAWLGNFPQAFSHVALVNTAHNLARPEKPAEQRSGSTLDPTEDAG